MDKNIVLAVIFGAAAVVGAMETVYQIYRLTVMDAAARGLKHPKLWGLLAANVCENNMINTLHSDYDVK